MLNKQEEKILKYMIEKNTYESIDVTSQCDSIEESIQIVESLEKKGLVINCNTLSNAIAILKQEGKHYFEQQAILIKTKRKEKWTEWIRYVITTLIAIAALIISIVK